MPVEEYPNILFEGPSVGLVIGVSSHQNGFKYAENPGLRCPEDRFPDLNYAAMDATRFSQFLSDRACPHQLLVDGDANLPSVKAAFFELSSKCKRYNRDRVPGAPDLLVFVYFAGHGWPDNEGQHYLIPHDARRDNLFGTALRHEELTNLLERLDTSKLVVFIDSCHSGGLAGQGAQEGEMGPADYNPIYDLGAGEGRYIISSCKRGQLSYEWQENASGIFTGSLLNLLKCTTDDIPEERITVSHLYSALRRRVMETAEKIGKTQEPIRSFDAATELVIAINNRAKQKRELAERVQDEKRLGYLRRLGQFMDDAPGELVAVVEEWAYGEQISSSKLERFRVLYRCLNQFVLRADESLLSDEFDTLKKTYLRSETLRSGSKLPTPQGSVSSPATNPSPPADGQDLKPVTASSVANTELLSDQSADSQATKVIGTQMAGSSAGRRQLSGAEAGRIIGDFPDASVDDCYEIAVTLGTMLENPVSRNEFSKALYDRRREAADDLTKKWLDEVKNRWMEFWSLPTPSEPKMTNARPKNAFNLMAQELSSKASSGD